MTLRTLGLTAAAAALSAAPIAAQAAAPAPIERASAAAETENQIGERYGQLAVILAVAAIIILGITLFDGDDSVSP